MARASSSIDEGDTLSLKLLDAGYVETDSLKELAACPWFWCGQWVYRPEWLGLSSSQITAAAEKEFPRAQ